MKMFSLRKIVFVFCIFSLLGCVNQMLHEEDEYSEKISSILISQDDQYIVVMTEKYHYIFNADKDLVRILKSPLKKEVVASFGQMVVEVDNTIAINFGLTLLNKSSQDAKAIAVKEGFKQTSMELLNKQFSLSGIRYKKKNDIAESASTQLNKSYSISVLERKTDADKVKEALLTPIAVAADGVLIIAAVPLIALVVLLPGDNWH